MVGWHLINLGQPRIHIYFGDGRLAERSERNARERLRRRRWWMDALHQHHVATYLANALVHHSCSNFACISGLRRNGLADQWWTNPPRLDDDCDLSHLRKLLFVILLALSALQFRGFGKRVHYGS